MALRCSGLMAFVIKKLVKIKHIEEYWCFLTFLVSRELILVRWDWMLLKQQKHDEENQWEMQKF